MDKTVAIFNKGVHNLLSSEKIPDEAAKDSLNFVTKDGKTVLVGGRVALGAEGSVGEVTALHAGYKVNGTKVFYRKIGTTIQAYISGTWSDIITGLGAESEYTFANYSSVAGAFTYVNGPEAYYKIINSHPTSPFSVYNSGKNFYGKILIDKGRTILWDLLKDKTGLYGSRLDRQNATIYTTVTNEAAGSSGAALYTGTLAFKGKDTGGTAFTVVAATDVVTSTAHGLLTGDVIQATTTGTLPVGMSLLTNYYVSRIDANTIFLFSDANLTARIDFTSTGAGVHTLNKSGARRSALGVTLSALVAAGTELFVDNYLGTLTSNFGGTGTINYATGAYSVTFSAVTTSAVTSTYQWEDPTVLGLADFTKSATRLAGEGFVFPQDQGGDAIINVLLGQDGTYYSMKSNSVYSLSIDADDLSATNEVYRKDMGLPFFRAALSTGQGIIFLNTANPTKPEVTILRRGDVTNVVEPYILFPHFKFSNYIYDDCAFSTYDRWILIFCKTQGALNNDRILMCNLQDKTVDIIGYSGRMSIQDADNLYIGDSVSQTVFSIFNGFDDMSLPLQASWDSKDNLMGMSNLKKTRRLRVKGFIGPDQAVSVYTNIDEAGFILVGTIRGDGTYVNFNETQAIGSTMIGEVEIGGGTVTSVYGYFIELKLKTPKFRTLGVRFVPTAVGYFDFDLLTFWDILAFEARVPKAYRQKQNVNTAGTLTDQ